jgi:hypothetical protein
MSKMSERALKAQEEKEREMQNDSKQQQVTPVDTQLPASWEEAAARVLKAASEGPMAIIKFKKGHYFNGEREVPLKTRYLAYCDAWACGWTKFIDGQPVERNFVVVATVAENKVPDRRDRNGLGDLDKSKWSKDEDGEPSDPWVFQHLLPLEDIETGERLLFATSSIGGEIGVKLLCKKWARNAQLGLPTIELAVGTYDTKKYRDIPRPDFRVIKRERGSTAEPVNVAPRPRPYSEPEEPPLEVYDADELEIGR